MSRPQMFDDVPEVFEDDYPPKCGTPEKTDPTTPFEAITKEMAELQKRKNTDYGSSFSELYKEFGMTSPIIKMSDKLKRIKTLSTKDPLVTGESLRDSLIDLANYAIMTIVELEREQDKELLSELNRIINHIDNGYLWRELSTFDLKLRERLKGK